MGRVEDGDLARWRALPASVTLVAVADHAKRDPTFAPIKDKATERWHATVAGREFELLLTGPKFFDTRAVKGGGGAVDFVMYLSRTDFRSATALLRGKGL